MFQPHDKIEASCLRIPAKAHTAKYFESFGKHSKNFSKIQGNHFKHHFKILMLLSVEAYLEFCQTSKLQN